MRRVFVTLAVLGLVAVSCGADSIVTGGDISSVAAPAPTVAGQTIEVEQPEIQVQTVLIGVSSTETIMLHALPGIDQPLAGDVPAGTSIEPMNNVFETPDGLIWWQVRAGDLSGWIQPSIAYSGPGEDITDQTLATFGDQGPFANPEAAGRAVAEHVAANLVPGDTPDIVVVSAIENTRGASVTVDLLGLEDDSLLGYRLTVSTSGTGAQPASIIQALLCARGVNAEGLCL